MQYVGLFQDGWPHRLVSKCRGWLTAPGWVATSVSFRVLGMVDCSCPPASIAPLVAFWLEGVTLPVVGGLGFMGNIAAILVLRSDRI